MSPTIEEAIRFQNVIYHRDGHSILNHISGAIYKGKITTLVGPSGAGKTTLLKLCNELISPSSGEIYINSKLITSYEPTFLRRNVGIVLQNAPIIRGTVFENLSLPRKLQKEKLLKDEALNYLKIVGLDPQFLNHQVTELSGGQKQKLSIARTLINRSEILLLDEITSALDPLSRNEIEQLILKINKKYSVTIVWITHNIQQAKDLGDYSWFMMNGQLIRSGKTSILSDTTNMDIKQFVEGKLTSL
nr:phosphate ABC transporter ATP-binding protein [Lysinibacillus timonensis]